MKSFFALLAILVSFTVFAQTPAIDFSGDWKGSASYFSTNYRVKYRLEQNGITIAGYQYIQKVDARDTAVKKVEGKIEGDQLILHETGFDYRKGPWCLSTSTFSIEKTGTHDILSGHWKGDWKLSTCPPTVGGAMMVYREIKNPTPQPTTTSSTLSTEDKKDRLEQEIINRLSGINYYAILIGIDDYSDSEINSLANPVADARKLQNTLSEHYHFRPENVKMLENPTRTDIIETFDEYARKITENDNLLIFYAGHGHWDDQLEQGYWLPSEASKSSKANWLSNSTVRDYLRGIKSKHTLLISDACFSGGILQDRSLGESSRAILEMYKLNSRKAMTSGTMTTVPDNSVFIKYLIKNLEENPYNLISADQLFRTFKVAVIHNSPSNQLPQYGVIREAGDEGGDFIFLKKD